MLLAQNDLDLLLGLFKVEDGAVAPVLGQHFELGLALRAASRLLVARVQLHRVLSFVRVRVRVCGRRRVWVWAVTGAGGRRAGKRRTSSGGASLESRQIIRPAGKMLFSSSSAGWLSAVHSSI